MIDLYAVDGESKVNEQYLHNFTDEMPFSMLKVQMVWDLLEPEKRIEYLFNLSLYHSRWEELGREDIKPVAGLEKGAELREEVTINVPPTLIPPDEYDPTERLNKQYLQKIIDLCKEQNMDIILMYIPYTMPEGDQQVANWGYAIADKNDIPYLNFVYEDLDINYATDCADEAHHLNASGAKKVTDYLGKYIKEHYDLSDHRNDQAYAFWHEDYDEYRQMKGDWLDKQQDTWSYLMLLNDKDYLTKIYATDTSYIFRDNEMKELIDNISVFGNVECLLPVENIIDDAIFVVEVYSVDEGELISSRHFVRAGEDVYEMY